MKVKKLVETIIKVPMNAPIAKVTPAENIPTSTVMAMEKNASGKTIKRLIISPPSP
jgi:hypothetical protein